MVNRELAKVLLEESGYVDTPAFERSITWPNRRSIPDVDSVYSVQNIPVAYFSRLSDADPARLWKLHKNVWNQSKVPLLYVILPHEIRVYNSYATPTETPEEFARGGNLLRRLEELTSVETARRRIRNELVGHKYDRLHLDTGVFWTTPDGQRIRRESRADQCLLRAMNQVRRHLLQGGLSNEHAYALLGRSILVRYLEDRGILTSEWISYLTDGRVDGYRAALPDPDTTYLLFERLVQRFNGDLFPVLDGERQAIRQDHLDLLLAFLNGDDLDTGQRSFWPYDFCYIPIELISGIYDTFLNSEDRRETGAYYTPLSLVDFVLEQTLPPETPYPDTTVLDPACGSGVFLVRAYQRLIAAWRQQYGDPTPQQLGEILKRHIFGVDINPSAIRIAAFSLYLAMLDHLDDQVIHDPNFRFPLLVGNNLLNDNFFSPGVKEKFAGRRFDRVIGNPPWGRGTLKAGSNAANCMKTLGFTSGGKQLVQAFLVNAPQFCADSGEIALLAPAKSTILVTSDTHKTFRQQFFERYDVRVVLNFSALCYELFAESIHPAVALFYHPTLPQPNRRIVYGVPKPSPLSRQLGAIVLDANEVKFLDQEDLSEHPVLWKVALWGTPRDAVLIERLQKLPTLEDQAEQLGWKVKEGVIKRIKSRGGKSAPWLQGKLFLPMNKFQPYAPNLDMCEPVRETIFHRCRTPDIFHGPLALLRHGLTEGRCVAAFSDSDIVYTNKVTGVVGQSGQEAFLKWLVAYVNSPIAQYYHFLTSTSWAIERGVLIHGEYKRMPFLVPDEKDPRLLKIVAYSDQIVAFLQKRDVLDEAKHQRNIQQREDAIAELVFDIYDLTPAERQLVRDTVDYGIGFFYWSKRKRRKPRGAKAVQHPDTEVLKSYADTFVKTVKPLLRYQGQTLNALVYQDGAPLSVVAFELVNLADAQETQILESEGALRDVLRRLDRLLLERRTDALYMRRHVRVYDGAWLYLVRPSERRFWTCSQALADADSVITEWLSHQRSQE